MDSEHSVHSFARSNGQDQIERTLAVSFLGLSPPPLWKIVNTVLIGFSWLFRPFANWVLRSAKKNLTNRTTIGLILCSRVALTMWEGVQETKWSFLSPPWQLRDKGNLIFDPLSVFNSKPLARTGIRTGKYEVYVDDSMGSAEYGIDNGIYNEDMAVAIVDEVENNKLNHKHWTCTGPIGLKEW